MGIGPDVVLERNPRLVYGRIDRLGPGRSVSAHRRARSDLPGGDRRAARTGSRRRRPVTPPPIVGDMGGGGSFLALGVVAALLEGARSGEGQVVDAAIVDGVSTLTAMMRSMAAR